MRLRKSETLLMWALIGLAWRAKGVPIRNLAALDPNEGSARIVGKVIWEGQDLTGTVLYLYRDASLKDLYGGSPLLSESGAFEVRVAPGTYYLVAVVDRNRSGMFDDGDALGIYGIRRWSNPREQKIPITVGDRQKAVDVNLYVSAIRKREEGRSRLVSLEEAEIPLPGDETPTSTVRGRVASADGKSLIGKAAYVFAYGDPWWRRRVGFAKVGQDGTYELRLPPGRYYLSAIVDANASNLFDEGDSFGVLGVTAGATAEDLRRTPFSFPVGVNEIRENVDILLTVRQGAAGKLVPLAGSAEPESEKPELLLRGRVEWEGVRPILASVDLYEDPSLLRPLARTLSDAQGRFEFRVPAGDYFLVAVVDRDGNGTLSVGDGVGGYGAEDIVTQPLRRYELKPDAPEPMIRVSAVYDDVGQLIPLPAESEGSLSPATGIIGRIRWDGFTPQFAWLLLATSPDFSDAEMHPIFLDRDGNFVLTTKPGRYYLTALVEAGEGEKIGVGDGVAVYGTRNPISGTPAPILVTEGRLTPFISMEVTAVVTDGVGGYALLDDGYRAAIRALYGEPNSRVRRHEGDQLVEEWWYWALGQSFSFIAEGPGWRFLGMDTFKPNEEALKRIRPEDLDLTPSFVAQNTVDARVYYVSDGFLWALEPDGSRHLLGYGSHPIPTPRGLLYRNEEGDLVALDGSTGDVETVLERGSIWEVAPSQDGTLLAHVRASEGGLQLRLRRWATREELIVPTDLAEISHPSWNQDATLIAFGGRRRSESASDIYVYDPVANRLWTLIAEATEEKEPVWSPIDPHTLAFTREGQLWLATFGENGEKDLRQLTHYGGEQPAWLPDGKGLLYVANGQLWTVDLASGAERPLLVNREPIFGAQPAAQRLLPRLVGQTR